MRVQMETQKLQKKHKRFLVGPLPLLHIIARRMKLKDILSRYIPRHGNSLVDPIDSLLLLVYNLTICKSPLYELEEWCSTLDLRRIGIEANTGAFSDDRFGKSLDKLFQADRSTLMTDLVVWYVRAFDVALDQIHNDSTTVKAFGKYPGATIGGFKLKKGHSKDHRPDLKQLVFSLTISADFAIPVHHCCYPGNRTDDTTHIETWQTLKAIFGKTDFLYVADSKLCTDQQLGHIVLSGGRAVTIVPETWKATKTFKEELKIKSKRKKIILRRLKPGSKIAEEYFSVYNGDYRSPQGYRIYWIYSSAKKERDREMREERIVKAENAFTVLNSQINRSNLKTSEEIQQKVDLILLENEVVLLLKCEIKKVSYFQKVQIGRGRPTANTKYRIETESMFSIRWYRNKENIQQEYRVDGIFPLLCTDDTLSAKTVLQAYKYQPRLEKRFAQFKSVHNAAPLLFKKLERVEANMFAFFIALALQSLLERELRKNMISKNQENMYIYPEDRECKSPTTSIVFDRFSHVSRYEISENGKVVERYNDPLSKSQMEILEMLNITENEYWNDVR
jgi:transposase